MAEAPAKRKKQNYVEVGLQGAKDLVSYDMFASTSDPYVKISLKNDEEKLEDCKKSYTSSTILKTLNPEWDESFLFIQDDETELVFQLFDHNTIGDDELMSTLVVPLSEISVEDQEEAKEFSLVDEKKKKDVGSKLLLNLERHLDIKQMKGRARKMRQDKEKLELLVPAKLRAEEKAAQLASEKAIDAKQIEDLQAQLKALQDDLQKEQDNLKEATQKAANTETELKNVESELEKAHAGGDEVEKALREENKALKASVTDLTAQVEAAKADAANAEAAKLEAEKVVAEKVAAEKVAAEKVAAEKSEAKHQEVEAEAQSSAEEPEKEYNSQDSEELGALRAENEALKQRVSQLSIELEKWMIGKGEVSEQENTEQKDESQTKEIQKLMENIKTLTAAKEKLEKELAASGKAAAKSSRIRWVIGAVIVLIHVLAITLYFVRRKRNAAHSEL